LVTIHHLRKSAVSLYSALATSSHIPVKPATLRLHLFHGTGGRPLAARCEECSPRRHGERGGNAEKRAFSFANETGQMKNSLRSACRLGHSFLVAYHHGRTDEPILFCPKGVSPFALRNSPQSKNSTSASPQRPLRLSGSPFLPLNGYITSLWVPHVE